MTRSCIGIDAETPIVHLVLTPKDRRQALLCAMIPLASAHLHLVVMQWTRPLCGPASMSQYAFKTRETMQPQEASAAKPPMRVLGIDIAKRGFHVVGMPERGQIVLRKRLSGARTALVHEIHGLLHAYGLVVRKGVSKFRQTVVGKLEAAKVQLTPLRH